MRSALIITGPSGVGKTTVATELLSQCSGFEFVRSATTRQKRGDAYDSEYIYLTNEEFKAMISSDGLLEYMEYGGQMYGTPRSEIDRIFSIGKIPLLILDINGVKSIRSTDLGFKSIIFYIYDDVNVIEQRLYDRYLKDSPTADKFFAFLSRKNSNRRDYSELPNIATLFDAFFKNVTVNDTATAICNTFFSVFDGKNPVDPKENMRIAEELKNSVV